MFAESRRLFLVAVTLAGLLRAAPSAEEIAESQRLFERANNYVTQVTENGHSYAYLQAYWKRAQANLDRIVGTYGETPIARQIRDGEAKIGPYSPAYFRDRVLPRLAEKRRATFDAVSCTFFLYQSTPTDSAARADSLALIIEVLCRQNRWLEALALPLNAEESKLRRLVIVREAARFGQPKFLAETLASAPADELASLQPLVAEALALRGETHTTLRDFLAQHPAPPVRLAALRGLITRETILQNLSAGAESSPLNFPHFTLPQPEIRDDVAATARLYFPEETPAAQALLAHYHAALGKTPSSEAAPETHLAHLDFLAAQNQFEQLAAYPAASPTSSEARRILTLRALQLLAQHNRLEAAGALRDAFIAAHPADADQAHLAFFLGQIACTNPVIVVRENTFAELPIQTPHLLAQAILEWSLIPHRSLRGPLPWDNVIKRFHPGF